ncbi:hypothetical protein WG936_10245 [Corynebacterium sp. H127]|uniref:hypothetical protein n=1 Tax=Corynebacterium sp. H127 TaxID=3133418 RepID=UPI00309C6425
MNHKAKPIANAFFHPKPEHKPLVFQSWTLHYLPNKMNLDVLYFHSAIPLAREAPVQVLVQQALLLLGQVQAQPGPLSQALAP